MGKKTKIRKLFQQYNPATRKGVLHNLKMISMFLSTLDGPIAKPVLDTLLPLFSELTSCPNWNTDNDTLTEMYSCLKACLIILAEYPDIDPKPLFSILTMSYKIKPHPSALDLLRSIVVYLDKKSGSAASSIFVEISGSTLACVAACQNSGNTLSEISDFLEAYLHLLAIICKKHMRVFLGDPDQIPQMLRCGGFLDEFYLCIYLLVTPWVEALYKVHKEKLVNIVL